MSKKIFFVVLLVLVVGISLPGCKSKESKKRYRTLHGTIVSVDTSNGTIVMNWFNEKTGTTIPIGGQVTKETEIYIDGKVADISQIKVDDEVTVEGYQKGPDTVPVKITINHHSGGTKIIPKKATTQPARTEQK